MRIGDRGLNISEIENTSARKTLLYIAEKLNISLRKIIFISLGPLLNTLSVAIHRVDDLVQAEPYVLL